MALALPLSKLLVLGLKEGATFDRLGYLGRRSRCYKSLGRSSSHLSTQAFSSHVAQHPSRVCAMAVATTEAVEVLVKAANGDPSRLGDCPFSQRVLLTLEEKGIPYNSKFVDMENKPAWFLEANPEGKVPVIKDDGKWVADSDVITQLIDTKFPSPSLVTPPEKSSVGSKIFSSFVKFLKSKDPSDGSEAALLEELKALDEYLAKNGPFVNGSNISAVDLSLAPKLYHLKIALGHYKQWSVPENLTNLNSYMEALFKRESFQKTMAPAEVVVKGWAKHLSA
ncbi:probable glutathione S-transferase DHAR1, cytosolic [Selaginella moellendorffii]|nr:probable glutathione S-transferase DHAR1, cytosolic [Selaginella moellendorffii]|eukprot:XP_002979878.2 probable glutathione S-transferase DHAR1, cytosolic [Selaginella moellendorffii]